MMRFRRPASSASGRGGTVYSVNSFRPALNPYDLGRTGIGKRDSLYDRKVIR